VSIQDEIPRSRINLRYRTNIKGGAELLELPFRLLILADLSLGTSADREVDLDTRRVRSLDGKNIDSMMEDMRMSMRFEVDNLIDRKSDEQFQVELPVKNRASFLPDQVASNVPKIRALLLLRRLLSEIQSNIDNRKEVRRILNETLSNKETLESLKKELLPYAQYQLPKNQALPAKPTGPTAK
jgi:type VI secretion system protein ImpB